MTAVGIALQKNQNVPRCKLVQGSDFDPSDIAPPPAMKSTIVLESQNKGVTAQKAHDPSPFLS